MTSTNDGTIRLWKDIYARIAIILFLISCVDFLIPSALVQLRFWQKPTPPTAPEQTMFAMYFFTRFVVLPFVIGFLLLIVAAGRLLKRKKIF